MKAGAMSPCWVRLERVGIPSRNSRIVKNRRSYRCLICDKNLTNAYALRVHMSVHTGERPFQCEHCLKGFVRHCVIRRHVMDRHTDAQIDPDTGTKVTPYQCPVCSKYVSTPRNLTDHINSHTKVKAYQCFYCPARYASYSGRTWHMTSVHDRNPQVHQCSTCKKIFKCGTNLRRHERIHSGTVEARRTLKCEHCDSAYTYVGHLKQHLRVHTGEKDHVCQLCGKGFHIKGNLRTHVNQIHTKERPYECRVCGKQCTQMSQWKAHERTHADGKQHKCPLCNKTFESKVTISDHFKVEHNTNKMLKCADCDKIYRSHQGLQSHRINTHGYGYGRH